MNRRRFLAQASAATTATVLSAPLLRAAGRRRPPRILVRSSWQTVNIGDIGHTPGLLRLLEDHLPEAEVRLWPSHVDAGVRELLQKRFPKLAFVEGEPAIKAAFDECDFLLHGSGPSFVAQRDVSPWHQQTGKPFGVYGITLTDPAESTIELLNASRFVFFRDSVSLEVARKAGCESPLMEFGPDAAFAADLRDDPTATAFLDQHKLEPGRFLCVIPRYRYTPYWKINPNRAFDPDKDARNQEMKEHDHAPLRAAITAVVRETPHKILICPEDQTQMAIGKEMLLDPLPEDVKPRVVWRENYWLTDEALSTYTRSAGLFGNEMHSPIMAVGNGVPAIVCRFAEQTSKGFMWRDIGLADWLFDHDQHDEIDRLVPTVLEMAQNHEAALQYTRKALAFVHDRQQQTMATVRQCLSL